MTSGDARNPRPAGLAGSALSFAKREAGRLPLIALTVGLETWERTRPLRHQALRHGGEVLQVVAHTPLGRLLPMPVLGDDAEAEAEEIATAARAARERATETVREAARETPAPAAQPPAAAVEMGAPGAVTEQVEQVTEQLDLPEPTSRDELPIPDFDNVSLGSLRARLRALSLEQLVTLRDWEQAHAHRLPVITLLDNRIAKLSAEADRTPYPSGSGESPGTATTAAEQAVEGAREAAEDEGGTLRI